MLKHYARKTDGSRHVQAEAFGDHIVADFVLIKRAVEQGVDGQNYMLVMKDIYSQYRYAYPVESREYEEVIKAVSHFLKASDTIGIAYTDNGREFIKAFEEMHVDHQTSIEYLDSTKSVVEREARTLIEGTRVNLNQAGMSLSMWPYAVRRNAMALNSTDQISGDPPSWNSRHSSTVWMFSVVLGQPPKARSQPSKARADINRRSVSWIQHSSRTCVEGRVPSCQT